MQDGRPMLLQLISTFVATCIQGLGPAPYIFREGDVWPGRSCIALRRERHAYRVKLFSNSFISATTASLNQPVCVASLQLQMAHSPCPRPLFNKPATNLISPRHRCHSAGLRHIVYQASQTTSNDHPRPGPSLCLHPPSRSGKVRGSATLRSD